MALCLLQWCLVLILFALPFLYELNSTFRYCAKMTLYYICVNIAAIFVIILSLWHPYDVENYRYVSMVICELRRLFGFEIEVIGSENLAIDEPCVIVANHQTSLDFFGMMEVWPKRCVALAKRSLQYMVPFGLAATLTGTVFVDRGNKKALGTMGDTATTITRNKIKVFIFPEGTRNRDGGMKPFKKGAFHLAVQAQVPILPVVFSSYNDFYSQKEKRFNTGKLLITCMPKIPTTGLMPDDVPELAERVREQMLVVFGQMSADVRLGKSATTIPSS